MWAISTSHLYRLEFNGEPQVETSSNNYVDAPYKLHLVFKYGMEIWEGTSK